MSKPTPPKCRTTNWPDYNRALRQRGSLTVWIDPDTTWFAPASGKNGRPHTYSDAAIQCFLTLKGLFGLPLRQTQGLLQSLIDLMHLPWIAPDSSTVCRRQQHLQVDIPYRPAQGGALHLLIDSTGIKMQGEGEWKVKKHGKESRRVWRKLHIGIDAQTLEIRAIEVTENSVGDPTVLPALLDQIPADELLDRVSADGAYDTKACHAAIAARGAMAVIPPRKNAKVGKKGGWSAARNEAVRAIERLGRALWKSLSGYHERSLVEAKMRCIKLLGERVASRIIESQVAELQIRAAILNRFTRLGTPVTRAVMA